MLVRMLIILQGYPQIIILPIIRKEKLVLTVLQPDHPLMIV